MVQNITPVILGQDMNLLDTLNVDKTRAVQSHSVNVDTCYSCVGPGQYYGESCAIGFETNWANQRKINANMECNTGHQVTNSEGGPVEKRRIWEELVQIKSSYEEYSEWYMFNDFNVVRLWDLESKIEELDIKEESDKLDEEGVLFRRKLWAEWWEVARLEEFVLA
ncbi:hypothetical protein RJT34_20331 [Clitoria ternatea]|uniref:Uncharacterized protein n=1 Tax=Clitoria ternatea TaxID=43366 RepID=A0AAN9ISZ1_CLITE